MASDTESEADLAERLRLLASTTMDSLWEWNVETGYVWWSAQNYRLYGLDPSTPPSYDAWASAIHPDDRERVLDDFGAVLARAETSWSDEYRLLHPDGSVLEIVDRACLVRGPDNRLLKVVGTATDVTATRQLERQLRHAQKMEAIGHLAGGIAHDFNNILQAALLELSLLHNTPQLPETAKRGTEELRAIMHRAATLTRQLLVFSRREAMRLRPLDVNNRIVDVGRMLRRVIGEAIALHVDLAPGKLVANVDPSMLDQILVNLAVNARDAMQSGGSLTIETSTRTRGGVAYVCTSVRDTGTGIAPDALPRIFEPFYTTKEPGRGTGLGLATVHGIVEQHGGVIEVSSTIDSGTTFDIYLPQLSGAELEEPPPPRPIPRGRETILVVEDDRAVRVAVTALLESSGYRVLDAERGAIALARWEASDSKIDLVLTDVVMPGGMSGSDLAAKLVERHPAVKIIFVTGYSAQGTSTQHETLQKPIDPDLLLRRVRSVLDAS